MAVQRNNVRAIDRCSGIAEVARQIAMERREKLLALCDAVLAHEYESAVSLARELSGNIEARYRIDPSKHRGAGRRG
jgi:hypothetical protein